MDNATSKTASDFLSITESFNFTQHVSGPTHNAGHTLDLVLSHGIMVDDVCLKDFPVSDHNCVLFNASCNVELLPQKHMSFRRIINETTAKNFSTLFKSDVLFNFNDVEILVQAFNDHCSSVLDIVAPLKTRLTPSVNSSPWINESIRSFRRKCRQSERLWKSSKLEAHRLHLKELLVCLNNMIRDARTVYFANLISANKGNSKVLFRTINNIVSPTAPLVPVFSDTDCNNFLKPL